MKYDYKFYIYLHDLISVIFVDFLRIIHFFLQQALFVEGCFTDKFPQPLHGSEFEFPHAFLF